MRVPGAPELAFLFWRWLSRPKLSGNTVPRACTARISTRGTKR